MNLASRLTRLERFAPISPDDCPGLPTAVYVEGEPVASPIPCRKCGQPHTTIIVEEIVPAPDAEPGDVA